MVLGPASCCRSYDLQASYVIVRTCPRPPGSHSRSRLGFVFISHRVFECVLNRYRVLGIDDMCTSVIFRVDGALPSVIGHDNVRSSDMHGYVDRRDDRHLAEFAAGHATCSICKRVLQRSENCQFR